VGHAEFVRNSVTMQKFEIESSSNAAAALQNEILNRTKLHTEMVRRLVNDPSVQPVELAGFLEDVANAYLSISEELSRAATEERKK
jgi:hypothetical protein